MLPWSLLAPLVRWGLFALLAVSAVVWGVRGLSWTRGTPVTPATQSTEAAMGELALHDPAAAEQVRKIWESRRLGLEAVSTAAGANAVSTLKQLAEQQKQDGTSTPPLVELAQLAYQSRELATEEEREAFLVSHTTYLETISSANAPELVRGYLKDLQTAAADPERMRAAFDDPTALLVWSRVPSPELRTFYHAQRDWIGELLVHAADDEADASARMTAVLDAARKYHPLPQRAVEELKLGWLGFEPFLAHGDLISAAVKDGIPLDDALDVVFANPEWVVEHESKSGAEAAARTLAEIRLSRPFVWLAARHSPGALRLAEACPREAEEIFAKYGSDDVPALILASYPDAVQPAAQVVVKYGDLGILFLARYRDDARFKRHLLDPQVGLRLIPYVALQGDAAFDHLEAGKGDLDKRFAADGTAKDPEWWTHIPGGGVANVARNYYHGYPNEWSELGWAALDVADATLLVATFGASAPASASRTGAEVAGRSAIGVGGTAADAAGRAAAKALGRKEAAELVVSRAANMARGSRAAAKSAYEAKTASSFLQRMARGGGAVLGYGLRTAGKMASGAAARTLETASAARRTWTAIPAPVRLWTARGLLAASLLFRLHHQIVPNIDKITDGLAEVAAASAKGAADLLGMTLAKAVQKLLQDAVGAPPGVAAWGAYVLIFAAVLAAAWYAWPGPRPFRRGVQYA